MPSDPLRDCLAAGYAALLRGESPAADPEVIRAHAAMKERDTTIFLVQVINPTTPLRAYRKRADADAWADEHNQGVSEDQPYNKFRVTALSFFESEP